MVQVKALRQEASILQMKSKGSLPEISLLFGGGSNFFLLFGPSTDWMRPTDSMGAICFTLSIKMLISSKENSCSNTQNVWLDIWAHLAQQLIHKINHHNEWKKSCRFWTVVKRIECQALVSYCRLQLKWHLSNKKGSSSCWAAPADLRFWCQGSERNFFGPLVPKWSVTTESSELKWLIQVPYFPD